MSKNERAARRMRKAKAARAQMRLIRRNVAAFEQMIAAPLYDRDAFRRVE